MQKREAASKRVPGSSEARSRKTIGRARSLKHRLANILFGDIIAQELAAVTVRVDDSHGWQPLNTQGPHDRDFSDWYQDQQDALEAWRKNFQVRRIVTLTRSYVLGCGITLSSDHRAVQKFTDDFVNHPKNKLSRRLGQICDELTRAGEVFPILFTNRVDGMSYIRFMPASQITEIITEPEDYETELGYLQIQADTIEPKRWPAIDDPAAWIPDETGQLPPVMLHFCVNRPIGATRGEGDLSPILRWCLRYSNWLEDRVRLNKIRTRQGVYEVELADDTKVSERKRQYEAQDPIRAGIVVHGPGEEHNLHDLHIGGDDAQADGKALRLAVASGANSALHYMGEGESANYATAREMGEPTARFYTERQNQLCQMLMDLVEIAYRRKAAMGLCRIPPRQDFKLRAVATETARADNAGLAEATRNIVEAFRAMRAEGWIDNETAVRLAFKFAGEALADQEIKDILARATPSPQPAQPPPAENPQEPESSEIEEEKPE